MSEATELTLGGVVVCSDGECGRLARVIVDPRTRALTHLVVEPGHGDGPGHLVPLELATATAEGVRLHCSKAELARLDEADETRLPPGVDHDEHVLTTAPFAREGGIRFGERPDPRSIESEVVPLGEAEVRRGDPVYTTDGAIGHVRGLVIAGDEHQLTQILLDEGHIFGRKEVAIPATAVNRLDDGLVLDLTTDQVRDLPPIAPQHG